MKFISILTLLLMTAFTHAGHIGDVTIKKIRLWDTFAYIETKEDMVTPDCATSKRWFVMNLDESHASNRKFSVVLAAHAQGKKFNPDCSSICHKSSWLGELTVCNSPSIQ